MTLRSFYHTLSRPLSPRAEIWTRRVLGAGLAAFAGFIVVFAASLIPDLRKERIDWRLHGGGMSDAGGMAFALVLYALVPAFVLAMFGSVSVWRNVAIKWWLPWLVMGALGAAVAALLG
jgi:hypothetical protein